MAYFLYAGFQHSLRMSKRDYFDFYVDLLTTTSNFAAYALQNKVAQSV